MSYSEFMGKVNSKGIELNQKNISRLSYESSRCL